MKDLLWRSVARIVTTRTIRSWLIRHALKTPYTHLETKAGNPYMERWWVFNSYPGLGSYSKKGWRNLLPSVRLHHILAADDDCHLHDHPWNARTIILCGWYKEMRMCSLTSGGKFVSDYGKIRHEFLREEGYTGPIRFKQYHRISEISPGGVYTLFITWKCQGTWGFLVDGKKVPYREYFATREHQ